MFRTGPSDSFHSIEWLMIEKGRNLTKASVTNKNNKYIYERLPIITRQLRTVTKLLLLMFAIPVKEAKEASLETFSVNLHYNICRNKQWDPVGSYFLSRTKSEEEPKSFIGTRTPFWSLLLASRKHIVCPKAEVFSKGGPRKWKWIVGGSYGSFQQSLSTNKALSEECFDSVFHGLWTHSNEYSLLSLLLKGGKERGERRRKQLLVCVWY